jgi:hypothetical protein
LTAGAGDADDVPHKTLAAKHGVDLDDVLSNRRIGSALTQGAAVPNWNQAHVACVLQVIIVIIGLSLSSSKNLDYLYAHEV